MKQTERIEDMELRLDRASAAVMDLSATLDKYEAALEDIAKLDEYYNGNEWRQDFADDEAGLLPTGLKRGVLSEDAVWNLLSDHRDLKVRMQKLTGQTPLQYASDFSRQK